MPHSGRSRVVPSRQGWRALLRVAPLTALWVALNYAFPIIPASGISTIAARPAIHALIALGLCLALERAELTPALRRNAWLGVMIPFTLWLALIWGSAINGVFRGPVAPLPLLPFAIFVVEVKGIGWRPLFNSWDLLYDNNFTGWVSSVTTHGPRASRFPRPASPACTSWSFCTGS